MSVYAFVFVGSTPLGSYLVGWLAESGGVRQMVLQVGALCLTGSLVGSLLAFGLRRRMAT
jgi:hypothetical protein